MLSLISSYVEYQVKSQELYSRERRGSCFSVTYELSFYLRDCVLVLGQDTVVHSLNFKGCLAFTKIGTNVLNPLKQSRQLGRTKVDLGSFLYAL
jgi:hypothetical protein